VKVALLRTVFLPYRLTRLVTSITAGSQFVRKFHARRRAGCFACAEFGMERAER
jgi:hypothetical protein